MMDKDSKTLERLLFGLGIILLIVAAVFASAASVSHTVDKLPYPLHNCLQSAPLPENQYH